jgi:hypothetical protein
MTIIDSRNSEGNTTMTNERTVKVTVKYLNALRKAAGLGIDPKTAEVHWRYAYLIDPYGDDPDLPEKYRCTGRVFFARSPGSDAWICDYDLPWERPGRKPNEQARKSCSYTASSTMTIAR